MAENRLTLDAVAVPTLFFSRYDLDGALRAVGETGFSRVDLWHVPGLCEHLPLDDDGARLGEALAAHGLTPSAFTMYTNPRENLDAGLELAGRLNVPRIILGPALDYHDAQGFQRLLAGLADGAEAAGVRLAVENHLNTGLDTPARLLELLEAVNHPSVRISLAPPHLLAAGGTIEDAVAALHPVLDYVYLWDMKPDYDAHRDGVDYGAPSQQLPGGKGKMDLRRLCRLLADCGYDGGAGLMCTTAGSLLPGRVTELVVAARQALADILKQQPHPE